MRIDSVFLPSLLVHPERSVCIVVDVLRATSVLVTLAARGVQEVTVCGDLNEALALRRAEKAAPALLCGEVGGLPPDGFDYGNSPSEFSRLDLAGRRALLFTSNGTRALAQAVAAPAVFAGAFLNRTAVAVAAVRAARAEQLNVTVVCSGTNLGTAYCLEDAFCAGAIVRSCREIAGAAVTLGDGAETALRLYDSFAGDATAAFTTAEHGRTLTRLGLGNDLAFCAQQDCYRTVPRVERRGEAVVVTATG